MAINFEAALGIHDKALILRSQRAEVLANNIANADTPGYQSRDMDFGDLLAQAKGQQGVAIKRTNARHISTAGEMGLGSDLKYRTPMQPSIDGNTVDTQQEMAAYMKNAMDYQASFQFLNSKFKGLTSAIRGE